MTMSLRVIQWETIHTCGGVKNVVLRKSGVLCYLLMLGIVKETSRVL